MSVSSIQSRTREGIFQIGYKISQNLQKNRWMPLYSWLRENEKNSFAKHCNMKITVSIVLLPDLSVHAYIKHNQ